MREAPLWAVHTVNFTFPLDLLLADKDLNVSLDCGAFCSCLAYIDVVHTSESTISIELIVTLHDSWHHRQINPTKVTSRIYSPLASKTLTS